MSEMALMVVVAMFLVAMRFMSMMLRRIQLLDRKERESGVAAAHWFETETPSGRGG